MDMLNNFMGLSDARMQQLFLLTPLFVYTEV
jgi:hypothetical protein